MENKFNFYFEKVKSQNIPTVKKMKNFFEIVDGLVEKFNKMKK